MKVRQFGNRRLDTWFILVLSNTIFLCPVDFEMFRNQLTSVQVELLRRTRQPHLLQAVATLHRRMVTWVENVSATAIQDASTPALAEVRLKFSLHVVQYMLWMLRCPATSCQAASSSGKQDEARLLLCIQGCRYLLVCSTIVQP
jgi:hypothetical protein